jgi:hypothetical protein
MFCLRRTVCLKTAILDNKADRIGDRLCQNVIAIWLSIGRLRGSNGDCVTSPNLCNQVSCLNLIFVGTSTYSRSSPHPPLRAQGLGCNPNQFSPNRFVLVLRKRRHPSAEATQWRNGCAIAQRVATFGAKCTGSDFALLKHRQDADSFSESTNCISV